MASEVVTDEKRLLAEADYVFSVDDWESTHEDFGTLADEGDLNTLYRGEITTVGRLKSLPNAYAINLPETFDEDGNPEDWEVKLFATREAATAAFNALVPEKTHAPD